MKRSKLLQTSLSIAILQTFFIFCALDVSMARTNVNDLLKYVGNPAAERYPQVEKTYGRNVWDMIGFQGKLYLGIGNSSNIGPSISPGAAPVIQYDPETEIFEQIFRTSEDQIDVFYTIDNSLLIPGHDPKESWALGNLYMSNEGLNWQKKRTIPNGVHTYCLSKHKDMLFAGLGTGKGAAVAISQDNGNSWDMVRFEPSRIYDFLQVKGSLYATAPILENSVRRYLERYYKKPVDEIFEYNDSGNFTARNDITSIQLFPETSLDNTKLIKIKTSQSIGDKAIYLGVYRHNDHQSTPFGAYVAESLEKNSISVKKINLPNGSEPWDIYVCEEQVYLLVNKKLADRTEVSVLRSHDLENWTELFHFHAPTFARSFAYLGHTFYFSLGSETANEYNWQPSELLEETGEIWKLDLIQSLDIARYCVNSIQ